MASETDITRGCSALGVRSDGAASVGSRNEHLSMTVESTTTTTTAASMNSPEGKHSQSQSHSQSGAWTGQSQSQSYNDDNRRKNIDRRSPGYIIRSGLAGGLAGCAAKTIVGPLDRVKILFQTSNPRFRKYSTGWFGVVQAMRDINSADGVRGLYKGHSATLLRIFPYAGIKFLAYEQIRAVFIPSKQYETTLRRLLSGSLAGMTSVFFTYPLEVVRVRLAFETKHGVRSSLSRICSQIYRENPTGPGSAALMNAPKAEKSKIAQSLAEGASDNLASTGRLANFYRGFFPTILGMFPYAGMSFLTHDTVGDWLRLPVLMEWTTIAETRPSHQNQKAGKPDESSRHYLHQRPQLTATAELLSGALSGLVAQTCSYPLEVIRRRMQVAGAVGDGRHVNVTETAKIIFSERGLRGFWVGLTIGYLKIVPMAAAGFYVYERAKWMFGI